MEKIFITEIVYMDIKFKVYIVDGKIEITSDEKNVNPEIIEEVKKIVFDKNKIKTEIKKKKIIIPAIAISAGLFIGTFAKKDILNLNNTNNKIDNSTDITYDVEVEIDSQDKDIVEETITTIVENKEVQTSSVATTKDYYEECMAALFSNENLTSEDCLSFMERYPYIEANKDNIDFNELLNSFRTVRIDRYDYKNPDDYSIVGSFTIDEETGAPVISLYEDATNDTLIHEQYHVIKYNKYYWDDLYYWDNQFIGTEEYKKLDKETQKKIIKSSSRFDWLYGNMIEEAHTSILTAEDMKSVEKLNIPYSKEVYIYKMYEQIFGKENMEKNMLQPNQVAGFMNNLLSVGCSRSEAIAIAERLDIYNNAYQRSQTDVSLLKYQICDDLAYVYNKKYNTIDDEMLKMTILSFTNDINQETIKNYQDEFKMQDLYIKFITNQLSIKNYLPNDVISNYSVEYGVNDILIDYFSGENPQIYVSTINSDYLVLKSDGKDIKYKSAIGNSETALYAYKLYTDYYEYATNHYGEDQEFAAYFASIYANSLLSVDQKVEILSYYEMWQSKFLQNSEARNKLFTEDYDTIMQLFKEIENSEEMGR